MAEIPYPTDHPQRLLFKLVKNLSAAGSASDSVLAAVQGMTEAQKQELADALAVTTIMEYKGTWDASANAPVLTSSAGNKGDVWFVGTAGTTDLNGNNTWEIGDLAIFSGTVWQSVSGADIAAVLYTAQTLSGPQQLQSRTNIGLSNVNNTSDAAKPISTATAAALANKMDKVANATGKVLVNAFGGAANSSVSVAATATAGALELVRGDDLRLQQSTTTQKGVLKTAVYADLVAGTATDLAVTPASLFDPEDPEFANWLRGRSVSDMTIQTLTTEDISVSGSGGQTRITGANIDFNPALSGTSAIGYGANEYGLFIQSQGTDGRSFSLNPVTGLQFSGPVTSCGIRLDSLFGELNIYSYGALRMGGAGGIIFDGSIGFFGASPVPQQPALGDTEPVSLTGVYDTDVAGLQAAINSLISITNGLSQALLNYGLLTY